MVAAGIGIGIASTGNPLGPIVYALIYSVINFATRIVAAHLVTTWEPSSCSSPKRTTLCLA